MLRRAYDLDNGVYSEAYEREHPYALIEAHEFETNAFKGIFHLYAERYERFGVADRFKISFTEFMQYHPEDCEFMISYCEKRQKEEERITKEAQANADKRVISDPAAVANEIANFKKQNR